MLTDYNLFEYALEQDQEKKHPESNTRSIIWRCRSCGSETPERELGVKKYRNHLNGKVYREAACPICGSMDVYPTGRHEK